MNQKKDVLITVLGKQNFGTHHDKVELTTNGSFEEMDNCYVLEYDEEQEPPASPVHVRVKVHKSMEEVQMERNSGSHSCLIIKQGARSQCRYGTDYGQLVMGLFGKKINLCYHEGQGEMEFRYVVDMNGQVTSRNQVKIMFKEN